MAIPLSRVWYLPFLEWPGVGTAIALNSSSRYVSFSGRAVKTGTIDRMRISVLSTAVAGSVPVYDARLETTAYDATYGLYGSNTLLATNTNKTFTPAGGTTHLLTLDGTASVTKDDLISATIRYSSGTIDASNLYAFHCKQQLACDPPGVIWYTGSAFSNAAGFLSSMVPLYDDDTPALFPCGLYHTSSTFSTWSSNVERGLMFRSTRDWTFSGWRVNFRNIGNTAINLRLFDDAGTELAVTNIPANQLPQGLQPTIHVPYDPITADADRWYRVVIHNVSSGSGPRMAVEDHGNQTNMNLTWGVYGTDRWWDCKATTRTYNASWNEGDWTNTDYAMYHCSPLVSSLGEVGGGLITHPGMSGGMRG